MKPLRKYWFWLLFLCIAAWLCTVIPVVNVNHVPPENVRVPILGEAVEVELNLPEGLAYEVEYSSYPTNIDNINVILHNNTDKELGYGHSFILQRKIDDLWYELHSAPTADGAPSYSYTEELILCAPGTSPKKDCWMLPKGDWFYPGHYRVVFDVCLMEGISKFTLAAEFDIE